MNSSSTSRLSPCDPQGVAPRAPLEQLHKSISEYFSGIMKVIREPILHEYGKGIVTGDVAEKVFSLLTSRAYCYLSRRRTERYKNEILQLLAHDIRHGRPINFYYDVGGGYHASIDSGAPKLVYNIGLGELFVLYQIASFCRNISQIYPAGVKFHLVVDNICAYLVNDIPIEKTSGYCRQFRQLINSQGMSNKVDLLVENEAFSVEDYNCSMSRFDDSTDYNSLTVKEIENVSRFTGHDCNAGEVITRIHRYKNITGISEQLFDGIIKGVHMTQRSTARNLCFRSFPGGDSRIQTGQVAITMNKKGRLQPVLLTSRNIQNYSCIRIQGIQLPILGDVLYVEAIYP